MTKTDLSPEVPAEFEAAVRIAVARDYPGRDVGELKCCAIEPTRFVVRVYLPVAKMRPMPYTIYAVQRDGLAANRLEGEPAEPYRIKNYK
jgi:hypothetical protein